MDTFQGVVNVSVGYMGRPQSAPTGRLAAAGRACRALGRSLRAVLRIRTFQVLVLQVHLP